MMQLNPVKVTNKINSEAILIFDKVMIILSVIAFYMEVWTHWFAKGGPIPPIFGVYLVFLYGLIRLFSNPKKFKYITRLGLFWWLFFFFLLLIANYIIVSLGLYHKYGLYTQDIFNTQLTSLGLSLAFIVILINKSNFQFALNLIVIAVIVGCIINFLDIVDFSDKWAGPALRAAGFYMNPNGSAINLSLGFAATMFHVNRKFRLPYYLLYCGGTLITLSRGAIPIVLLLGFVLIMSNSINIKSMILAFVSLFIIATIGFNAIKSNKNYNLLLQKIAYNEGIQNRILTILNPGQEKFETGVRDEVALDHFMFYLNSPIVGNGLSSSMYVQKNITSTNHSSHIQYIHMLNEYGLLGLLIIFGLPFSMLIYKSRISFNLLVFLFTIIYLIGCLSSHNMYDLRSLLFSYAIFGLSSMHFIYTEKALQ